MSEDFSDFIDRDGFLLRPHRAAPKLRLPLSPDLFKLLEAFGATNASLEHTNTVFSVRCRLSVDFYPESLNDFAQFLLRNKIRETQENVDKHDAEKLAMEIMNEQKHETRSVPEILKAEGLDEI